MHFWEAFLVSFLNVSQFATILPDQYISMYAMCLEATNHGEL